MAKFKVGPGFFADFYTTPIATANGEITVADAHLIRISVDRVEDGFENFIGDFTYTPEGLPLGTVHEYRFETGAELIYIIADANIDVLELRNIASLDDPQKFLEYIFRSDDKVIGANLDDVMAGYAAATTFGAGRAATSSKAWTAKTRFLAVPARTPSSAGTATTGSMAAERETR